MTPQPILIHGTPCLLQQVAGGYAVTNRATGAVITRQPARLLAVARAALVLCNRKD